MKWAQGVVFEVQGAHTPSRRVDRAPARARPIGESNPAASSDAGGRIPIMGLDFVAAREQLDHRSCTRGVNRAKVRFTRGVSGWKLGGMDCGSEGVLQPLGRAMLLKASVPVTAQHTHSANGKRWMPIAQGCTHGRGSELDHQGDRFWGEGPIGSARFRSTCSTHAQVGNYEVFESTWPASAAAVADKAWHIGGITCECPPQWRHTTSGPVAWA